MATLREQANGDWVLEEGTLVVTDVVETTLSGMTELQVLADDAEGQHWGITLGDEPTKSSLEHLIGQEVVEVTALAAGELRLQFSDGTEVSVSPRDDAEGWEIRCDENPLLVADTGGGLFGL